MNHLTERFCRIDDFCNAFEFEYVQFLRTGFFEIALMFVTGQHIYFDILEANNNLISFLNAASAD